jgi:hypothetical protein
MNDLRNCRRDLHLQQQTATQSRHFARDVPNHALVIHVFFVARVIPSCLFTFALGIIATGTLLKSAFGIP